MGSKSVILFILVFQVRISVPHTCDETELMAPAGNLGQAGAFPWLGVIRVHLHEGAKLRVALTGAILVKAAHAIAIADDIARIPKNVFQYDSRAMFIASDNQPTLCSLKDYLLHPEYQNARYNTIALIELEPELEYVPVLPICWPSYLFNASNQLYAFGYTDEKQLLEKEIHRMQYIDQRLCNDYYYMAGLYDVRYTAKHSLCGQAVEESYSCEWDNGMVLASNASGPWVLLGLGIRGPGCGAPSRFIEMHQYLQWIESSTTDAEEEELGKSAFGTGFRQLRMNKKERIKDIPVHKFFRAKDDSDTNGRETGRVSDSDSYEQHTIDWFSDRYQKEHYEEYNIERLDKDAIIISKFKDQYEKNEGDCLSLYKNLVYTETMKIYSQTNGIASYKISLMDLMVEDYTCVIVRLESPESTDTHLWYNVSMQVDEPLGMFDRSPDFHIKHYPIPKEELEETKTTDTEWKPNENLEPHFVKDDQESWKNHTNVNLYMRFRFDEEAYLKLQVWGRTAGMPQSTIAPRTYNRNKTTTEISTTTPKTGRLRFKSKDKNKSALRTIGLDLQQPITSEHIPNKLLRLRGITSTREPHLVEVQSDNDFRLKSRNKDETAHRTIRQDLEHIRNKPLRFKEIISTKKPRLVEVQSDNDFRLKGRDKDETAHKIIRQDLEHIQNKPLRFRGIISTKKPRLVEVQPRNDFRLTSRDKHKSTHKTSRTDLQPNLSERFNNGHPLRLRHIISTRNPHIEIQHDDNVGAKVLQVESRTNDGFVNTEAICFLAFLNIMF